MAILNLTRGASLFSSRRAGVHTLLRSGLDIKIYQATFSAALMLLSLPPSLSLHLYISRQLGVVFMSVPYSVPSARFYYALLCWLGLCWTVLDCAVLVFPSGCDSSAASAVWRGEKRQGFWKEPPKVSKVSIQSLHETDTSFANSRAEPSFFQHQRLTGCWPHLFPPTLPQLPPCSTQALYSSGTSGFG